MRRDRPIRGCDGVLKEHAFLRHLVNPGRSGALVAVTRQVVRAESVQGNEKHVAPGEGLRATGPATQKEKQEDQRTSGRATQQRLNAG